MTSSAEQKATLRAHLDGGPMWTLLKAEANGREVTVWTRSADDAPTPILDIAANGSVTLQFDPSVARWVQLHPSLAVMGAEVTPRNYGSFGVRLPDGPWHEFRGLKVLEKTVYVKTAAAPPRVANRATDGDLVEAYGEAERSEECGVHRGTSSETAGDEAKTAEAKRRLVARLAALRAVAKEADDALEWLQDTANEGTALRKALDALARS